MLNFRLVLHGVKGGPGKQPVTYQPCAALTSAVAAGRNQSYARMRIETRYILSFTGLLERTYMSKELLLMLQGIDISPY